MDFLTVSWGNPLRGLQNCSHKQWLFSVCACKTAVPENSFQILFWISPKNGKKAGNQRTEFSALKIKTSLLKLPNVFLARVVPFRAHFSIMPANYAG